MAEPRVIQADYANWRPVAGRKVLQLVFEVPIEQTAEVMARLGVPMPGESRWCAIALLNEFTSSEKTSCAQREPKTGEQQRNTVGVTAGETAHQPRRPFASLPRSQQAAIRCQDNEFKLWIGASNAEDAADKVRRLCGISSRSELNMQGDSAHVWLSIERDYQAYLTDRQYADARR